MKPFTINRNSWHYALNKNFMNEDGHFMEQRWERMHNNFCSYWRATMLRLITAIVLAAVIIGILILFAVGIYANPIYAVIIAAFTIVIVMAAVLVAYMLDRLSKFKDKKPSNSLFAQKYRAHKERICPTIEYINE